MLAYISPVDLDVQVPRVRSWRELHPIGIVDAKDCTDLGKLLELTHSTEITHVICPDLPERRWSELITTVSRFPEEIVSVGLWHGTVRNYDLFRSSFTELAIPHKVPRGWLFSTQDLRPEDFWFYEFSSLDELRRLKPKVVVTHVPVSAALRGIDLRSRERRPKNLSYPEVKDKLSEQQQKLACLNLEAILEAYQWL
jgi:hypothetical protein